MLLNIHDDDKSDRLLLLKLRAGNNEAFDALYERHWQSTYTSAFKRLQDADQAKDITQEIFLQVWLKREVNEIENIRAYLSTAVRNKVLNWYEKQRRFTPVADLLLELTASHEQTDAKILKQELMITYEALLNSLTASQQQIFKMRYQQDLSTAEIAEKLDISRKTVQNQLGKAVAHIRSSLMLFATMAILSAGSIMHNK